MSVAEGAARAARGRWRHLIVTLILLVSNRGRPCDLRRAGTVRTPGPNPTKVVGMSTASEALPGLMTLEELTSRVGMSVRNIRFYTPKGLVPPPIR